MIFWCMTKCSPYCTLQLIEQYNFFLAVYKDQGFGYRSVVQELCNKIMADARIEVKATQGYIASGDVS